MEGLRGTQFRQATCSRCLGARVFCAFCQVRSSRVYSSSFNHQYLIDKTVTILNTMLVPMRESTFFCLFRKLTFLRLLAAKSTTFPAIESATRTILNVLHEIGTHTAFYARFGITADELESTEEPTATMAYGGYLLDIGLQGKMLRSLFISFDLTTMLQVIGQSS